MFKWIRETVGIFFDWIDKLMAWVDDTIQYFVGLIERFFKWIDEFVQWAYDLLLELLQAAWDMYTDYVCWIFEELLDIVIGLVNQLDLTGIQQFTSAWGDLPDEIINVMGLCGVGDASIIIVAAIFIRLILQLIPFVRLGS